MARPKKLSDADAVRLVDSLYEECGDPRRLKFSELEKHAATLNMNVKAYDLRRHEAVLRRIAELEALNLNSDSFALAYKNLDIDGFIGANRSPAKLKRSLVELDERWHKLYDYAVELSNHVRALSNDLQKSQALVSELKAENAMLITERRNVAALKAENASLRKTFQKHLYPTLADEALAGSDIPVSFGESVRGGL